MQKKDLRDAGFAFGASAVAVLWDYMSLPQVKCLSLNAEATASCMNVPWTFQELQTRIGTRLAAQCEH
eukprot:914342-Amphidinium_carterae.1